MRVQLEPIIGFGVTLIAALLWCGLLQLKLFGGIEPDFTVEGFAIFLASMVCFFASSHFALNLSGLATGKLYLWGGSIAMAIASSISTFEPEVFGATPERSAALSNVGAAVLGAVMAFAYREFAGLVPEWEEKKAFAWLNATDGGDTAETGLGGQFSGYEGPVQVRTSVTRMFLAQAAPWTILYVCWLCFYLSGLMQFDANLVLIPHEPGASYDLAEGAVISSRLASLLALVLGITAVFQTVFAMGVHLACRFVGIRHILGYAFMGIVLPSIVFVVIPQSFPMVGTIAVGMAIYRKIAGLEPKNLPEPVHVSDPAALVAADHSLRRRRQIVPFSQS